jgi:hypothetical protein
LFLQVRSLLEYFIYANLARFLLYRVYKAARHKASGKNQRGAKMRTLKPKYDVFWGAFDGYIRSFYGTKRAIINRLKRMSHINFVEDLRVLDDDGRVVYGDIEFDDVKSPEYGNFFTAEEWSECINCTVLSEQEIDDICARKDGYYYGRIFTHYKK